MGVDYYAHAAIGVMVRREELYRKVPLVSCRLGHPTPAGAAYCPRCGAPLPKEGEAPIDGFDGEKVAGWPIVWGTDQREGVIVAMSACTSSSRNDPTPCSHLIGPADFAVLEDARKDMERDLAPLGLWSPSRFGLWSLLYCSY